MNKNKLIILFSSIIVACVCIYFAVGNYYISDSKMKTFINESESKASYVYFNNLYYGNTTLNLEELVNCEENSVIQQVFCIKDSEAYFSYQYVKDSVVHWCLASVSINTMDCKLIFDEIFDMQSLHKYEVNVGKILSQRNGYVFDNKIVITDFIKLVEYDLENDLVAIYNYDEYQKEETKFVWDIDKFSEVMLEKDSQSVVINKSKLSDSSNVAKEILASYDRMVWHNLSSTKYFFNDVQFVNEEIYILCSMLNRHGETYTLIFECDIENEEYKYCGYHFTKDITRSFYVVPTIQTK